MRRQIARRGFDHFAELGQLVGDGQFARIAEQRQVGLGQRRQIAGPLVDHRADAGMGVLDVIDRVFVGLALGQIEVEIEVLVGLAQRVEEAAGIVADFRRSSRSVTNSPERGRHRGLLAIAVEHGELDQRDTCSLSAVEIERLDGAGDTRDVAVVVGAPDVDDLVETALELVQVVGDVGGEIGEQSRFRAGRRGPSRRRRRST